LGLRAFTAAALFAAAIAIAPARADEQPLTVTIEDGEVLFQGSALDTDQLTEKLKATGRQKERIYFRLGPNAKTVYAKRVIAAIKAAGFTDIAVMPPAGLNKKAPEPPL
jgi:biopolymer transport protein ExbD